MVSSSSCLGVGILQRTDRRGDVVAGGSENLDYAVTTGESTFELAARGVLLLHQITQHAFADGASLGDHRPPLHSGILDELRCCSFGGRCRRC